MIMRMLLSNKYLNISHSKKCYANSYVKLALSFMYIKFQLCGIFEGLSHTQEVETVAPFTFVEFA